MMAIIIEDEARAQRTLQTLLEMYCPQIEVIGLASRISEAVKIINDSPPDLVFLDIELPGENGFALFKWIPNPTFKTIFTTAYERFAIDAFRVSALDYLLKPIQAEQLVRAVAKLSAHDSLVQLKQIQHLQENISSKELRVVSFPLSSGLRFVNPMDIILLKADGSYTHVWLVGGEKLLISRKLGELEFVDLLPYFCRTHRSFVVNLHEVKEYVKSDGAYLLMKNGEIAGISREKKEEVLARLR